MTGISTAREIEYAAARVGVAYLNQNNIRLFRYTVIKVTVYDISIMLVGSWKVPSADIVLRALCLYTTAYFLRNIPNLTSLYQVFMMINMKLS